MRTVRCSGRLIVCVWREVGVRGVCLGGCPPRGVCLRVCAGGVYPEGICLGDVCPGVCLGGCPPGEGVCPGVYTSLSPVDRILDTRLWK